MLGLILLLVIVAGIVFLAVKKHGWKGVTVAVSALGVGLYAGGKQMLDAFMTFFGG